MIVISAYPLYPGWSPNRRNKEPFPGKPNFGEIGSRTGGLIAESSISKEFALAWAAISLWIAGVSAEKVQERTGSDNCLSSTESDSSARWPTWDGTVQI